MPISGSLKGKTRICTVVPSTTAYTAGDNIGGKLTFTNIITNDYGSILLKSARLMDTSTAAYGSTLFLTGQDLSTGTAFTDNSAFDPADTDLPKLEGVVPFSTSNVQLLANAQIYHANAVDQIINVNSSDRSIYGALVAVGTPTFACAQEATIVIEFEELV